MADTSHPESSDVLHYHAAGEPTKHRAGSYAATVIAVILAVAAGFLGFKLKQESAVVTDLRGQLERAQSETTAAKAELTTASTKSAGLQTQLDKANSQQANLQAQLKKSEDSGANSQAQLDKAQADLKAQQEKVQTQSTEFQSQLTLANDRSAGLTKELAAAKIQINDLNGQLTKAKTDVVAEPSPAAAAPRTLPLTTELKKSFFGGTFTLQIKNTSADPLKLDIGITGSDKTPSRKATIEGNGTLKVDGVAAGANIVIASEGFQSLTVLPQPQ